MFGNNSTFWNVRAIPNLTTRLAGVCISEWPSKITSPESTRADQAGDRALFDVERDVVERNDAAEAK
jgi:hypothetical protein